MRVYSKEKKQRLDPTIKVVHDSAERATTQRKPAPPFVPVKRPILNLRMQATSRAKNKQQKSKRTPRMEKNDTVPVLPYYKNTPTHDS